MLHDVSGTVSYVRPVCQPVEGAPAGFYIEAVFVVLCSCRCRLSVSRVLFAVTTHSVQAAKLQPLLDDLDFDIKVCLAYISLSLLPCTNLTCFPMLRLPNELRR